MNYNNYTDEYRKPMSPKKLLLYLLIVAVVVLLGLIACLMALLFDESEVADKSVAITSVVQSTVNTEQNSNENYYVVKNEGGRFYDTNNSANIGSYSSGSGSDSGNDSDDSQDSQQRKQKPDNAHDNGQNNEPDNTPNTRERDNRDDSQGNVPERDRRDSPENPSSSMQGFSMIQYLGLTLEQVQQGMNCGYSLIDPYEGSINGVVFDSLPFEFYFYSYDGHIGVPRPAEEIYMVYFDSSTSSKMVVDDNFTSHSTYAEICSEGNGELIENLLDGGYMYVHTGDDYNIVFGWYERPSNNKSPDIICVTQQIN